MEIGDTARKHGISDEDILHAITNAIRYFEHDGYTMIIGPTHAAALIEVAFNDTTIFHAMPARPKFLK